MYSFAVERSYFRFIQHSNPCFEQRNFYDIYLRSEGSQQRGAGSAGCIGGDYLGQDTVGPPGGDPINCKMMKTARESDRRPTQCRDPGGLILIEEPNSSRSHRRAARRALLAVMAAARRARGRSMKLGVSA